MYGGVVHEKTVLMLSMLAQRLAMITEKQDHAGIIKLGLLQPCKQSPEFMVCVGDLSVIQMGLILAAKRLRWIIRAVRIVQMKPEEKRPQLILFQPRQSAINALPRSSVHQSNVAIDEGFWRKGIVVKVESPS